jgi:hypothetical protein
MVRVVPDATTPAFVRNFTVRCVAIKQHIERVNVMATKF